MELVWLLFVYGCSVTAGEVVPCTKPTEGYFWRDYTGTIPSDAIPGGTDDRGETTYIGQAFYAEGHLTPGVIRKGSSQVFYNYPDKLEKTEEDVKILCSQLPKQFSWLQVINHQTPVFNVNGTVIFVGRAIGGPFTIGRKNLGSEVAVGKVLVYQNKFSGMWYVSTSGLGHINTGDNGHFEILVFNPNTAVSCSSKSVHINFYY